MFNRQENIFQQEKSFFGQHDQPILLQQGRALNVNLNVKTEAELKKGKGYTEERMILNQQQFSLNSLDQQNIFQQVMPNTVSQQYNILNLNVARNAVEEDDEQEGDSDNKEEEDEERKSEAEDDEDDEQSYKGQVAHQDQAWDSNQDTQYLMQSIDEMMKDMTLSESEEWASSVEMVQSSYYELKQVHADMQTYCKEKKEQEEAEDDEDDEQSDGSQKGSYGQKSYGQKSNRSKGDDDRW